MGIKDMVLSLVSVDMGQDSGRASLWTPLDDLAARAPEGLDFPFKLKQQPAANQRKTSPQFIFIAGQRLRRRYHGFP
jgi:hypothetical protein